MIYVILLLLVVFVSRLNSGLSFPLSSSRSFRMSKRASSSTDLSSDGGKKSKSSTPIASSPTGDIPVFPPAPFCPPEVEPTRTRLLSTTNVLKPSGTSVLLWMSRDQRLHNNHAVIFAQRLALQKGLKLKIVFNLVPHFLEATIRQFGFMLKGLQEVEGQCREMNIPFTLLTGNPVENIPRYAAAVDAACVVVDFSPLRVPLDWVYSVRDKLSASWDAPFVQVDAHNIVPVWAASPKLEYSARTIRSKITALLPKYLTPFAEVLQGRPVDLEMCSPVDWSAAFASLKVDTTVPEVTWIAPGPSKAQEMLDSFISARLKHYADKRNNPNISTASNLSPYFHFGQLSPQYAVLQVKQAKVFPSSTDAFVEETVVRRELADNFCFYNKNYDNLNGCYDWARVTLAVHASDARSPLYTRDQLEQALTYDDLWNAAQLQMVAEGKMHGFLRMYWAKKILEWTSSPEEALRISIFLNDKYELDGRDPNGYVGCMWSIGGVHDQGWGEREIFGKIRFMNYEGCKKKFDVPAFVAKYPKAKHNAAGKSGGDGKVKMIKK